MALWLVTTMNISLTYLCNQKLCLMSRGSRVRSLMSRVKYLLSVLVFSNVCCSCLLSLWLWKSFFYSVITSIIYGWEYIFSGFYRTRDEKIPKLLWYNRDQLTKFQCLIIIWNDNAFHCSRESRVYLFHLMVTQFNRYYRKSHYPN